MGGKDSLIGRFLGNAEKFSDEQVAQTISLLVEHGIKRGATDIHIEPREQYVLVRYRIDGNLSGMHKLPYGALRILTKQLKELAHLRSTETNVPQEGRYTVKASDRGYDVQVSTLPVIGGEKIVLHLRPQHAEVHSLEALGFWGGGLQHILTTLARAHGLIVVAGPKRAGTSTTLRSLIDLLNMPNVNIASVEDHIEHRLNGVSQTQVNPQNGISFLEGLQAVLRQDPNIVLLGNVPDKATAELAVHAASTGHLILAGLHADSAAGSLLQLQSTGIQPFLLTAATRLVVAQRLARKLCPECRERYAISAEERTALEQAFGLGTAPVRHRLHELEQQAVKAGIGSSKQLNTSPTHPTHLWRANEDGCERCDHTGYQGRIALVEIMSIDDAIRRTLLTRPTASELETAARKAGFIPLLIDGLVKSLRGETTVEEVLRAAPAHHAHTVTA